MENKNLINPQDLQIQGLLDRYLRSHVLDNEAVAQESHLDEDTLAAFTEGKLSEREAQSIFSHLVDCSFCRHVTAELIRLDLAFADETVQVGAVENQPSKISEVLGNIMSRIFGTNDGVVFAHEEKEKDLEVNKDSDNKN